MKYYKSPTNEVWAYELDGSQDHLIPEEFIAITKQEADQIAAEITAQFQATAEQPPTPTKEELMAKLLEIQQQLQNL